MTSCILDFLDEGVLVQILATLHNFYEGWIVVLGSSFNFIDGNCNINPRRNEEEKYKIEYTYFFQRD